MPKLKPLSNRVVVKRDEAKKETKGGILLPDTVKEKWPTFGTVLAVGPGKTDVDGCGIPCVVKIGDRVLFSKHAGMNVEMPDGEVCIMTEDEILSTVE